MSSGKVLKMTKEARELFDSFDSNHDGKIEKSELIPLLNKISKIYGLPNPTQSEINEGFKQLDLNQNNLIEFEEFIHFYQELYNQMN